MRILILTQHFAPEVTAARARLQPFAELLAVRGHDVEVICAVPNHPEGVIRPGYRGRPSLTREIDGYRVRYVWVKTSPVKSTAARLLFYGSYASMATAYGVAARRPDVVLASSPPLPVAAAGMAVAAARRVPWVMDVRDPWPDAAVALGELTDRRVIAALEALELRLYRSASAITAANEAFRAGIVAKLGEPGKVKVLPNGTTREWMEAGERDASRADLGMPAGRFVLTYAGNVGLSQGLEHAVEAAAQLDDGFQLQIVGAGPRLEELQRRAADLPAGRVAFRGLVEPELAARYLRASDASLVPLLSSPEIAKVVPSKLFDYWAVDRPVILASSGEAARLASEADAAMVIEPEDASAIRGAVERLRSEGDLAGRLAGNGRRLAEASLRELQVERLERILLEAARRDAPA